MSHEPDDPDLLEARLELLAEENDRLREEYARTKQTRYHHTAIGLASLGAIAIAAALAFPGVRDILIAIGAIGLFGAILVYYLTPETVLPASIGEHTYDAMADTLAGIVASLGLRDIAIYTPTTDGVHLFVPQPSATDLPEPTSGPIVTDEATRGLFIRPTGAALLDELERTIRGDLPDAPGPLADQLADGVVEVFELASSVDADIEDDQVTFAVSASAFGAIDRFDHPLPSTLAAGLAAGLDEPIRLDVDRGDERHDWLVTCHRDVELAPT